MNDPESHSATETEAPQPEGTRIGPMLLCEEKADGLRVDVRPGMMLGDSQADSREQDIARKCVANCLDWNGKADDADEPVQVPVQVPAPQNMTVFPAAGKRAAVEKTTSEKPGYLTNKDQFSAWCERQKWEYVFRVAEPFSPYEIRLLQAPPG